jgi:hypothetical protein
VCREREREREEREREREERERRERTVRPHRSVREDTQAEDLVLDFSYAGGVALMPASVRTGWPRISRWSQH